MSNEYLLKIIFMGEHSNDLVKVFAEHDFEPFVDPTGLSIMTKKIQMDNNQIKLYMVTLVHNEFPKLLPSYYRGSSAGVFVFDKGSLNSFNTTKDYYQEFKRHIPDSYIPVALIGIVCEEGDVSTKMGQSFAESKGIDYYEMQKKDTETFKECIFQLAKKSLAKKE